MKFIKCSVVVGLCLLTGACPWQGDEFDIDIGGYEYHLAAWNAQNMLDYQIKVVYFPESSSKAERVIITVKNGIPENSDPPAWLTAGKKSSIPEFYSFIQEEYKRLEAVKPPKNGGYFKVRYNTKYHYPENIVFVYSFSNDTGPSPWGSWSWSIQLMPLEEGELDIDIGDYEGQFEAWNSRNMLDYQIEVGHRRGDYEYNGAMISVDYNVKNGIPDDLFSVHDDLNEATIPTIYSFIKEKEEIIRNAYNGINRSYLHVQYNTEYHYPTQINMGIGHRFGLFNHWEITLTPGEGE